MINWPEGFCAGLVDRGLYVIRFDSRDTGRSTHFTDAAVPDVAGALAGDLSCVSYTLSSMAADGRSARGAGVGQRAHRGRLSRWDGGPDDRRGVPGVMTPSACCVRPSPWSLPGTALSACVSCGYRRW